MSTARTARRVFELLEPICLVSFFADECNEALVALGHRTYWDGYFASRAAPLGRVQAQVVHAAFYSFADGEAARHIPSAWETIPPEASVGARERGSAASLRRILGEELAVSPGLVRAADLTTKAAGRRTRTHHRDAGGRGVAVTSSDPSAVGRSWCESRSAAPSASAATAPWAASGSSARTGSAGGAGSNVCDEDAEEPLQLSRTTATRACRQPPRLIE